MEKNKTPPKRIGWVIILGIVVVALVGHFLFKGGHAQSDDQSAVPRDSDTLRIGMDKGILSFDPQNNGSYGTPLMNIFDTLVRIDKDGHFQPHLAERFRQIDPITWEFSLHHGIRFHNGDELTANDVKFTLDRVVSDKSLIENPRFASIKAVKVLDKYDFQIVTRYPDPVLLNRLVRMGGSILPEQYFKARGVDYFTQHPVGSGPYEVVKYELDHRLVLKRFDGYFKGKVSDWKNAVLTVLPDAATRVNELLTGGMDLVTAVPPSDWNRINSQAGLKIVDGDSTQVMLLIANCNRGFPTSDPRVRQAIEHAIDSRLIVKKLFNGLGTPTQTHITPGTLGFEKSLYNTSAYDPEKARALLKEAGYSDGHPLKLTLQIPEGRYQRDSELGQLIAAMLAGVGIQVEMELLESSKYVQVRNSNKNKDLMLAGYGNSMFDPFLPLNALNSKVYFQRIGYRNEKVDSLLDQAMQTTDQEQRARMYEEVQQILVTDLPYIYLYNERYFTGINSKRVSFVPPVTQDILVEDIKKK
ncbi:ABC transporter substrate-binding protein [Caballeronia sp. INDeC2]|uniref:ABC transporter substrate-binding protein n=1 Tax=Caballeronia sp. INDeC2 TaxID=2921747 RepID=UPI002027DD08|nr:ABC transporter substrate-binding protein [Caballeronia sp. INDeC2]